MGIPKGKELKMRYSYDFTRDGGAISEIALTKEGSGSGLQEGFVITDMTVYMETELTSAGTPTLTLGNSTDPDGYFADFFGAVGDDVILNRGDRAGALIWDDTNDHPIHYRIDGTAANQDLVMDVGTAAVTAGKLLVTITGYVPPSF